MVKPGYKETEIGVIPQDWDIYPLKSISDVKTGPFGSALHAEDYVQSGTPIITVEHLGENSITRQNLPMVSEQDVKRLSAYILRVGDVVFSRVGSVDRNAYVTDDENGWLFSGRLLRIRPKFSELYSKYLGYYFKFDSVKNRIKEIAVGQTMASLNTKLMNTFLVTLPPVEEQRKIAEALSDMDELIASLEKLIAKKKAVKQGAMQELLTGKKRLPGFDSPWTTYQLGELGSLKKGNGISRAESNNGTIPAVRYGELYTHHINYIKKYYSFISKETAAFALPVSYGDILFSASGETKEDIGRCASVIDNITVYVGGDIIVFSPRMRLDPIFMGSMLNCSEVQKQKSEKGQGDAVVHIRPQALSELHISIPEYDEQKAIASILFDMDAEIETLEQKLAKCRQTKQGMMQQLLTGRIRLV